jgi:hypothetical protein
MTKNAAQKKATRELMEYFNINYRIAAQINNGQICAFCQSGLKMDKDGMYKEEVGEFWSEKLDNSVLGHPDCTPNGIDAIISGEDPDWKMA